MTQAIEDALFGASQVQASDGQLARISELMAVEDQLNSAIDTHEALLSDLKQRRNEITREQLPTLMAEAGVEKFKCSATGTEARLTFEADGALGTDQDEKDRKIDVLIDAGADEIVKMVVTVAFSKGEFEKAKQLAEELRERELAAFAARSIHPQTLKSWIKERMEAGDNLPLDEIGIWYGQVAKIKRPKQ
jgi:hypothetical protein